MPSTFGAVPHIPLVTSRHEALPLGVVFAPPAVVEEFGEVPPWLSTTSLSEPTVAAALGLVLGRGESEAIALAADGEFRVILKDYPARAVAARLEVEVVGAIGLLLRAKQECVVNSVRPWLDALEMRGLVG